MLRRKLSGFLKIGLMQPLGRLPKNWALQWTALTTTLEILKRMARLSALEETKAQIENINLAIDEWQRIVERCRAELNEARTSAAARQKNLPFDQMILYNNFVHISHRCPRPQRGLVLYDEGYEGGEIITEK